MIPLLKDKSYSFAVEIVRLVQYLQQEYTHQNQQQLLFPG